MELGHFSNNGVWPTQRTPKGQKPKLVPCESGSVEMLLIQLGLSPTSSVNNITHEKGDNQQSCDTTGDDDSK